MTSHKHDTPMAVTSKRVSNFFSRRGSARLDGGISTYRGAIKDSGGNSFTQTFSSGVLPINWIDRVAGQLEGHRTAESLHELLDLIERVSMQAN